MYGGKMKYTSLATILITTLTLLINQTCGQKNDVLSTILMDAEYLAKTKIQIDKNDQEFIHAFNQLIEDANKALEEGPFTVTDKEVLSPSGNKNDYASYGRYWWPDPNKPDGLPYIWRDGETNPESQSIKKSDRPRIGALARNSETLGLAYYLTKEKKYAKKTAELLRVWFINDTTRMNPNLNHAQCRLGHNDGYKSGILDGRLMISALEASLLIAESSELSNDELKKLKDWAKSYFEWLTTNEMALEESKSKNNHGTYYDVQTLYLALYSGNLEAAKNIANNFTEKRILTQISPEGSMPHEIARTRSLFYSIYNLQAMFAVANLAKKVDVDIFEADNPSSRLKVALDYLVPYTNPEKIWPQPTIDKANRLEMFQILQMANNVYKDKNYLKMLEKLPHDKLRTHRAKLVFPLLR